MGPLRFFSSLTSDSGHESVREHNAVGVACVASRCVSTKEVCDDKPTDVPALRNSILLRRRAAQGGLGGCCDRCARNHVFHRHVMDGQDVFFWAKRRVLGSIVHDPVRTPTYEFACKPTSILLRFENSRWRKQTRPTRLGSPPLDVEALNNDRLEDLELIEI